MDQLYFDSGYIDNNFYVYTANANATIELGNQELSSSAFVSTDAYYIQSGYFADAYIGVMYDSTSSLTSHANLIVDFNVVKPIVSFGRPNNLTAYNNAGFDNTKLFGTNSIHFPTVSSYVESQATAAYNFDLNENFLIEFFFQANMIPGYTTIPLLTVYDSSYIPQKLYSITINTVSNRIEFKGIQDELLLYQNGGYGATSNKLGQWNYVRVQRINNTLTLITGKYEYGSWWTNEFIAPSRSNSTKFGYNTATLSLARYDEFNQNIGFQGYIDELFIAKGFNSNATIGQNLNSFSQLNTGSDLTTVGLYHFDGDLLDTITSDNSIIDLKSDFILNSDVTKLIEAESIQTSIVNIIANNSRLINYNIDLLLSSDLVINASDIIDESIILNQPSTLTCNVNKITQLESNLIVNATFNLILGQIIDFDSLLSSNSNIIINGNLIKTTNIDQFVNANIIINGNLIKTTNIDQFVNANVIVDFDVISQPIYFNTTCELGINYNLIKQSEVNLGLVSNLSATAQLFKINIDNLHYVRAENRTHTIRYDSRSFVIEDENRTWIIKELQ